MSNWAIGSSHPFISYEWMSLFVCLSVCLLDWQPSRRVRPSVIYAKSRAIRSRIPMDSRGWNTRAQVESKRHLASGARVLTLMNRRRFRAASGFRFADGSGRESRRAERSQRSQRSHKKPQEATRSQMKPRELPLTDGLLAAFKAATRAVKTGAT